MLIAGMEKDIRRKWYRYETKSIGFITKFVFIDLKLRMLSNFGAKEKHSELLMFQRNFIVF